MKLPTTPEWFDHRAVVAVILAFGVSASIVIIAAGATFHRGSISSEESNLLSTVLGAAIGAVATYLGITFSSRDRGEPPSA